MSRVVTLSAKNGRKAGYGEWRRALADLGAEITAIKTHGALDVSAGRLRGTGNLPSYYATALRLLDETGVIDAVAYSYWTPIAVRANGVWLLPAVRYSTTTSQHQNKIVSVGDGRWLNLDPFIVLAGLDTATLRVVLELYRGGMPLGDALEVAPTLS